SPVPLAGGDVEDRLAGHEPRGEEVTVPVLVGDAGPVEFGDVAFARVPHRRVTSAAQAAIRSGRRAAVRMAPSRSRISRPTVAGFRVRSMSAFARAAIRAVR